MIPCLLIRQLVDNTPAKLKIPPWCQLVKIVDFERELFDDAIPAEIDLYLAMYRIV